MSNKIHFRLRSEKEEVFVQFDTSDITIGDLKDKIANQKQLKVPLTKLEQNVNLIIEDKITSYQYENDMELITAGSHVIVYRHPPTDQVKYVSHPQPRPELRPVSHEVISVKRKLALQMMEQKIPEILVCQLCGNLLDNPVLAECCGSRTACKACTEQNCACLTKDWIPEVRLQAFINSILVEHEELEKQAEEERERIEKEKAEEEAVAAA